MNSLPLILHSTGSLLPPVGYDQPLLQSGLAAYSRRSRPRHYGRLSSGAQARVGRGTMPARAAILRSSAMVRRSRGRLAQTPTPSNFARRASACGPLFRVEVPETNSGAVTIAPRPYPSLCVAASLRPQQLERFFSCMREKFSAKHRRDLWYRGAEVMSVPRDGHALNVHHVSRDCIDVFEVVSPDMYRIDRDEGHRVSIIRADRPFLDAQQGLFLSGCAAVFSALLPSLETTVGRPFLEGAVTSSTLPVPFFVFWVSKTPWRDALVQTFSEIFSRTFRYCPLVSV